jgi:hypothetical protein
MHTAPQDCDQLCVRVHLVAMQMARLSHLGLHPEWLNIGWLTIPQKLKENGASHPEHWHSPGQVTAAKGVRSLVRSRDHQGDHSGIKF